jgi:hypothetical protein
MRRTRRRKQGGGKWSEWLFGKTKSNAAVVPTQGKTMSARIGDFFSGKKKEVKKEDLNATKISPYDDNKSSEPEFNAVLEREKKDLNANKISPYDANKSSEPEFNAMLEREKQFMKAGWENENAVRKEKYAEFVRQRNLENKKRWERAEQIATQLRKSQEQPQPPAETERLQREANAARLQREADAEALRSWRIGGTRRRRRRFIKSTKQKYFV